MIDEVTHNVGGTCELPFALPESSMLTNLIRAPSQCDDCCVLHSEAVGNSDGITNMNL
jgi:hypothetical protein